METGVTSVKSTRAPAATNRPTIVRRRGSPAATRLPNTMTRMAIVTGHESISERSMADRLASLKLAQSALSPVRVTEIPGRASSCNGRARAPAAFTMALGSAAAPAVTMPVRPSRESESPASGGTTAETLGFDRSIRVTRATTCCAAGSDARGPWWSTTTTCSAVEPRPAKSRCTMARARTDWLVESCHPAPARACSARTANTPKVPITTSQINRTARRWVAVQRPSRASGPGRLVVPAFLRSSGAPGVAAATATAGCSIVDAIPGPPRSRRYTPMGIVARLSIYR